MRGTLSHGGFRGGATRPEPSYRLLGDGAGNGVRVGHDGPVRPPTLTGGASEWGYTIERKGSSGAVMWSVYVHSYLYAANTTRFTW